MTKIEVLFTAKFIRMFKKLDPLLQKEVEEKIHLFENIENHKQLKVHKLKGEFKNMYSFSIDYKNRIVFQYGKSKEEAILLVVGDHNIYR